MEGVRHGESTIYRSVRGKKERGLTFNCFRQGGGDKSRLKNTKEPMEKTDTYKNRTTRDSRKKV